MTILELESQVFSLVADVNGILSANGDKYVVFRNVGLSPLLYSCSEAGFLRNVSWIYTLYNEMGRVNVDYLAEFLQVYNLDPGSAGPRHRRTVHHLRTFLQHSLDPNAVHDNSIQSQSQRWLLNSCGTDSPRTDDDWAACLQMILLEAVDFLKLLLAVSHAIELDPFKDQILADWEFRISRYRPPHEFSRLIEIVSSDMGLEHLDSTRLCKKYYDSWIKEMEVMQGDLVFEVIARKMIERELLKTLVLPITGNDIITEFKLAPGPLIGDLLRLAKHQYEANPCPRDELIERLRLAYFSTTKPPD